MLLSFRSLSLAALTGISLLVAACGDKNTGGSPKPGNLEGTIAPAGSITTVTATPSSGSASTATPTSTGAYSFSNLAAGSYNLTFTPEAGYTAPAAQSVTVSAGSTTTVPAITVASAPAAFGFTLNGTSVSVLTTQGSYSNNTLTVYGGGAAGQVQLIANNVTGPGTYSLVGTNSTIITFSNFYTVTTGTLQVTALNPTTRKASGTFSCSATGATVTNGSFTNLTLR